jgi:3-phenylpropionate/cinnamic acid dioxygenase small subunit
MTTHKQVAQETDLSIRRILARYCHLVDDRDFDAAAALFTEDARFRIGEQTLNGREAIRAWLDSVPPGLSHQVTNVVVSNGSRDDTVHALSDLVVARKDDGGWSTLMLGRYHDTLVKTEESLVFTQRIVTDR